MNTLAAFSLLFVAANAQLLGTPASTALLAHHQPVVQALSVPAPAPVLNALPAARVVSAAPVAPALPAVRVVPAAPVAPALPAARVIQAAPVVQQIVQPATVSVQVPVTRTVHYESRPEVTGVSTQILKAPLPAPPAIPFPAVVAAARVAPAVQQVVAAPAPVVPAPVQVASPVVAAPAPEPVLRQALPAPVAVAVPAPVPVFRQALPAPVTVAAPAPVLRQALPASVVSQVAVAPSALSAVGALQTLGGAQIIHAL